MDIQELKSCIATLTALRDEIVDEGFEPAGNIEREHHLADMLMTWQDAVSLHGSIEVCRQHIQMLTENEEG